MEPLSYTDARLVPLRTDDDILDRVTSLIGRATLRQLWLLFLDADDVQLPLLVPIDGLPSDADADHCEWVARRVRDFIDAGEAAQLILVWERYASPTLTAQDAARSRSLHEACVEHSVPLRALLLSHRAGVRWIAPDDYLY